MERSLNKRFVSSDDDDCASDTSNEKETRACDLIIIRPPTKVLSLKYLATLRKVRRKTKWDPVKDLFESDQSLLA